MLVNRRVCHRELSVHTTTSKCYIDSVRDRGIVFFQRRTTETLFRYATRFPLLYCPFLPFFFFFFVFTLGRGAPLRAELHYVIRVWSSGFIVSGASQFRDRYLRRSTAYDECARWLNSPINVQRNGSAAKTRIPFDLTSESSEASFAPRSWNERNSVCSTLEAIVPFFS